MLLTNIKDTLATCGLPLAYRLFPEGESPGLPYVVWYVDSESNFAADGENYHTIRHLTVELYTRRKDIANEAKVESALNTLGIWSKTEEYISSEKCIQTVYYLEV